MLHDASFYTPSSGASTLSVLRPHPCSCKGVAAGQELDISYTPLRHWDTRTRRDHLASNWLFFCECRQCSAARLRATRSERGGTGEKTRAGYHFGAPTCRSLVADAQSTAEAICNDVVGTETWALAEELAVMHAASDQAAESAVQDVIENELVECCRQVAAEVKK